VSPLDREPVKARSPAVVAAVGAAVVHAAFVIAASAAASAAVEDRRPPARVTQMIDVELPKPAPEPPPPPPTAPAPAPPSEPPRQAPVRARAAPAKREAPPPLAAQAAQVHAVANEVVDFGETFVAGAAETYAGGVTESGGTATHAVTDTRARAAGVEGGTGTKLAGDLSRAPQLAGGVSWDCPFPEEADALGLDAALVTLRVDVDRQGGVARVDVVRDPGDGFGREARRCAMRKRWAPGLDRGGNPTPATAVVHVRFQRR
jgi:periplasmic protein TonB